MDLVRGCFVDNGKTRNLGLSCLQLGAIYAIKDVVAKAGNLQCFLANLQKGTFNVGVFITDFGPDENVQRQFRFEVGS